MPTNIAGQSTTNNNSDIAIIGMTGRFPGAASVEELWRNLRDGVESVTFFTDEELLASGIDSSTLSHPNYVKAGRYIEGIDMFDASFFGCSPREARFSIRSTASFWSAPGRPSKTLATTRKLMTA